MKYVKIYGLVINIFREEKKERKGDGREEKKKIMFSSFVKPILSAITTVQRRCVSSLLSSSSSSSSSLANPLTIKTLAPTPSISQVSLRQSNLLQSVSGLVHAAPSRGYKTKSALKLRCPHCFFAKRRGKLRVICKENPRHKQVQI
jgi:large subunit ribosomal protein L36